jgi:hypothetical protein
MEPQQRQGRTILNDPFNMHRLKIIFYATKMLNPWSLPLIIIVSVLIQHEQLKFMSGELRVPVITYLCFLIGRSFALSCRPTLSYKKSPAVLHVNFIALMSGCPFFVKYIMQANYINT